MDTPTDQRRSRIWWLVAAVGTAAFVWWVFETLGRQTTMDLVEREVVQLDGGWFLRGRAVNKGPAVPQAYVEVQYFQPGGGKQTHQRFTVPDIPADGEFPFTVGPLTNLDPERRRQVSVYLGARPDPYGGM